MAYDAKTQRLISLKKLAGKAQTSNDKDLANEGLPSGLTLSAETIFGEPIATSPSKTALYTVTGKSEYIRFPTSFIAGSDTPDGRHGFELKLPSDYEANSTNPLAGTYPFINDQTINITSGSLQLIPPSFATAYEANPYYGGTAVKDSGTIIPVLDARDWYLDYFNGVFFQQDPPGTGAHVQNPDYVQAFLYIGDMLDVVVKNSGSAGGGGGPGDPNAEYLVLAATGSLSAERVFTLSTGLSASDGGAGGAYTISTDPKKFVYEVTQSHAQNNPLIIPSLNFGVNSYDFNKNDIFLNGQLMTSGSGKDYVIAPVSGSAAVTFFINLLNEDVVIVRQN